MPKNRLFGQNYDNFVVFLPYWYRNCIAQPIFSGIAYVIVRVYISKSEIYSDCFKGLIMYDNEMIEFEDEMFNHFLHHFDECDLDHIGFNEEYDCIDVAAELIEEIIWP